MDLSFDNPQELRGGANGVGWGIECFLARSGGRIENGPARVKNQDIKGPESREQKTETNIGEVCCCHST